MCFLCGKNNHKTEDCKACTVCSKTSTKCSCPSGPTLENKDFKANIRKNTIQIEKPKNWKKVEEKVQKTDNSRLEKGKSDEKKESSPEKKEPEKAKSPVRAGPRSRRER